MMLCSMTKEDPSSHCSHVPKLNVEGDQASDPHEQGRMAKNTERIMSLSKPFLSYH